MRPHPNFIKAEIPTEHILGAFHLKALTVNDLVRDFAAVMESATEIKAANPSLTWPDGLTLEKNLIDLAWHQREFEARRSFAWVIEGRDGTYLGCFYVYPSLTGDTCVDVVWWWRTGIVADTHDFRDRVQAWLSGDDWPDLTYNLQTE